MERSEMHEIAVAIMRLASAIEDHNAIEKAHLARQEAADAAEAAEGAAFEKYRERRRAAWQVFYKRVVAPVFDKFVAEGGAELLQTLFSSEKEKPS